jgi:hypothetical protein
VILCSAFEAPAVVSSFNDIAVVSEAIEQSGRHLGVRCSVGEMGADGQVLAAIR